MTDYQLAINSVAKVTRQSAKAILSPSKLRRRSDARMVIVLLLAADGYKDNFISYALRRSRARVQSLRTLAKEHLATDSGFAALYDKSRRIYESQKILRSQLS